MKRYCVLGSLNMDMVTRVQRFPRPGETLRGISFNIFPGGKGANQAVALAKLGAVVDMVGALGDDVLGSRYEALLGELGIGSSGLARIQGLSTGTASIEVSSLGENQIVVVAAANDAVTPAWLETRRALVENADCLLLQLEVPMESVLAAARMAKAAGAFVILDPAPALDIPPELYPLVSVITPNETEAAIITGCPTDDEAGIARAGTILLERGAAAVVVKAGGRGAFLIDRKGMTRVPGFAVRVVDTVAAGDSFNAGLAFALGQAAGLAFALSQADGSAFALDETEGMLKAIRFANAVGALSTTKEGAQSAMPSLAEVEALLNT